MDELNRQSKKVVAVALARARAEERKETAWRISKLFSDGGKEEVAQYILANEGLIETFEPR